MTKAEVAQLSDRGASRRKKISQHEERVLELIAGSHVHVSFSSRGPSTACYFAQIEISGLLSKLPSAANQRRIGLDRRTGTYRPFPDASCKAFWDALTRMYANRTPRQMSIGDSHDERFFALILLADSCSRMDSHNVDKGVCDWLQSVGLINNDRYGECLSIPKAAYGITDSSSTIVQISRAAFLRNEISALVSRVQSYSRFAESPRPRS